MSVIVSRQSRQSSERSGRHSWSPLRTVIVAVLAITYVYPFVFLIATAFKPREQYSRDPVGWPTSLTSENLERAWNSANLGQALINSTIAVSIGVLVCCATVSLAAFWFVRHRSRISGVLLGAFGGLWILPQVVWVIPFFIILSKLDLTNNLVVLGIAYGTVFAPAFIWLLWAYFLQGLPAGLLEAAEIDGASLFQQYLRIALPLSVPALAAVAALTFVFAWGDLLLAIVLLQDPEKFTVVPSAATLVSQYDVTVPETTAAALITVLPPVVILLFAQKAIVRGITGGFSK